MVDISRLKPDDVEKAYDFLRNNRLFEPTGKVSKAKLQAVLDALHELGDVPQGFPVERLVLSGITQLAD